MTTPEERAAGHRAGFSAPALRRHAAQQAASEGAGVGALLSVDGFELSLDAAEAELDAQVVKATQDACPAD